MTTKQVAARVPQEIADALEMIAKKEERSLSQVIARALKQYIEGQKK